MIGFLLQDPPLKGSELVFLLKYPGFFFLPVLQGEFFFSISKISRGLKNFSYPSKWEAQCRTDPSSFEVTGGFLLAVVQFISLKFLKATEDTWVCYRKNMAFC